MLVLQSCESVRWRQNRATKGFTLLEVLVVVVIIGILGAIAAPMWIRYVTNRRVTYARDELRQAIQQAQTASINRRESWRFSLREQNGRLEWAVHANEQNWSEVTHWQPLHPDIELTPADTTLAQAGGVYYVRFGFKGEVKYRLSTVTLRSKNGLAQNRCVVISTLLGATREGEGQLYPNGNDRYCY